MNWIEADSYLFDIDGTLLNASGGAHYHAFHSALRTHLGLECAIDGVPLHGNTDIGILRAVCEREGITASRFESCLPAMLESMSAEVDRNRSQLLSVPCPGIPELVALLRDRGKLLGVASGNLERIGWLKLEACGLREFFVFGAFSDRHEKRADIFRHASEQVRERLGADATVCVLGDTPADIHAAKANSIPVIAVATGIHSRDELAAHSPDLCVASCSELAHGSNVA